MRGFYTEEVAIKSFTVQLYIAIFGLFSSGPQEQIHWVTFLLLLSILLINGEGIWPYTKSYVWVALIEFATTRPYFLAPRLYLSLNILLINGEA